MWRQTELTCDSDYKVSVAMTSRRCDDVTMMTSCTVQVCISRASCWCARCRSSSRFSCSTFIIARPTCTSCRAAWVIRVLVPISFISILFKTVLVFFSLRARLNFILSSFWFIHIFPCLYQLSRFRQSYGRNLDFSSIRQIEITVFIMKDYSEWPCALMLSEYR